MKAPSIESGNATGSGTGTDVQPVSGTPTTIGPDSQNQPSPFPFFRGPISLKQALPWSVGAIASFQLAYQSPPLGYFILAYLLCLLQLARLPSVRAAFYFGLATAFCCVAPQLYCFWVIFGFSAIALWLVVAFWIALFVALAQVCFKRFGPRRAALLIPILWTGLEYFRSELYYLRFSWLNVGYAFADGPLSPLLHWLGMYGVGFVAAAAVGALTVLGRKQALLMTFRIALVVIVALFLQAYLSSSKSQATDKSIRIAGIQLEFPTEAEVLTGLDKLLVSNPAADLYVLSEYTLDGPVPDKIKEWCRQHQRYLVVGGKDPAPKSNFYDTAFVVGPGGEIIFRQVKSVPIQFFKDGLPATEQKLWDSPWGKLGFCVCYDLSYTRVMDPLIRMGAQAIIQPTMDIADWGRHQHELHARVAPVRAAEYGVPIFRLASSGISQLVDSNGRVVKKADFPGQAEILSGELVLAQAGLTPLDRWLAPFCSGATGVLVACLLYRACLASKQREGRAALPLK